MCVYVGMCGIPTLWVYVEYIRCTMYNVHCALYSVAL